MKTIGSNRKGFTVVEFMVATMVFSIVLMATTFAIIAISRAYQRSVNDSKTQAATRNLVDTVAQAVQYGGSAATYPSTPAPANVESVCFGNRQFIYTLGRQLGSDFGDTRGAFVTRISNDCATPENLLTTAISGNPTELLSEHMRLARFSVSTSGGDLYKVNAKVVYGDNEVLCLPSISNCTVPISPVDARQPEVQCLPGVSSRFCSVSELTVTVQRRVQ